MASIFQYKNSKVWWIKWYSGGKHHYESTRTKDRKYAEYLRAKKEQEIREGKIPASLKKIRFDQALAEYWSHCRGRKKKKTIRTDKYYIEAYLRDHPAPELLKEFDVKTLTKSINDRVSAEEISSFTGNGWLRAWRTFFSWCVKQEYLDKHPLAAVENYSTPEQAPKYLSKEEIKRLLEAAENSPIKLLVATAIYAGLRSEELATLEWENIDFEHGKVWVKNKEGFTTKSWKERSIPLHPALRAILEPCRKQNGLCFDTVNLREKFDRLKEKAGVQTHLHILRHTFGAYCAMNGVPLPLLKEWMGHSSIKTTMIYAKLRPDVRDNEIEKLRFG